MGIDRRGSRRRDSDRSPQVKEWLAFLAVVFGWALVGRFVLELQIAQPWAVALVWLIGLIWLIGWAAGSAREADYLLKLMGGMIGVPVALVAVILLVGYVFS